MSLRKILLSAVVLLGASATSTFALDANTKEYCEAKCTQNHCKRYPHRLGDCIATCGGDYVKACESGVSDKNLVKQLKDSITAAQ